MDVYTMQMYVYFIVLTLGYKNYQLIFHFSKMSKMQVNIVYFSKLYMYVCAGGGRGWQTYPKSWPKKKRKKNILFDGWGGVAIAKASNFNVNFLKKKSPSYIFIIMLSKRWDRDWKEVGAVP